MISPFLPGTLRPLRTCNAKAQSDGVGLRTSDAKAQNDELTANSGGGFWYVLGP